MENRESKIEDGGKSHMKYGAHCYLFTDRWSDDQLHHLDAAVRLGLQSFELSVGDDVSFDARRTGAHAAALGLTLLIGPGGVWPYDADMSSEDPRDRERGLAWHKRQVDTAAACNAAGYMGALYGHPGTVKRRRPPAEEQAWAAEGLHALAAYAEERHVVIALEPMSHFRTHIVNTPVQIMQLLVRADQPNLRVLFDTYHSVTEVRNYPAAIRTFGSRLFAVHACENDRGVPGGGLIPWDDVFGALCDVGFEGIVGLEAYNSSLGDFAFQRGMFHNVCPDGEEFVRRGISFLRSVEARARKAAVHGRE
jgi:D-psicose/D-tagatose/L-ribulose 3-epimerase